MTDATHLERSRIVLYTVRRVQMTGDKLCQLNEASICRSGEIHFLWSETMPEQFECCYLMLLELRQNVWDQLYQLDGEYRQYEQFLQAK